MSKCQQQQREPNQRTTNPTVLALYPLIPLFDDVLTRRFRFLKPWESPLPLAEFLSAHADAARVLICSGLAPVDAATIARLPRLELVVATSVGVNHVDLVECRRRGIAVTNVGGAFSEDAADYAVGLLIDVLRRVSAADRFVRAGQWPVNGDYPLGSKVRIFAITLSTVLGPF